MQLQYDVTAVSKSNTARQAERFCKVVSRHQTGPWWHVSTGPAGGHPLEVTRGSSLKARWRTRSSASTRGGRRIEQCKQVTAGDLHLNLQMLAVSLLSSDFESCPTVIRRDKQMTKMTTPFEHKGAKKKKKLS